MAQLRTFCMFKIQSHLCVEAKLVFLFLFFFFFFLGLVVFHSPSLHLNLNLQHLQALHPSRNLIGCGVHRQFRSSGCSAEEQRSGSQTLPALLVGGGAWGAGGVVPCSLFENEEFFILSFSFIFALFDKGFPARLNPSIGEEQKAAGASAVKGELLKVLKDELTLIRRCKQKR